MLRSFYNYYLLHLDPDFAQLVQHRFHRVKKHGVISEIYDGSAYFKYSEYFEYEFNFSFALNFDGAPKFKSSSIQLWPIQLNLNELPPALRYIIVQYMHKVLCISYMSMY